MITEKKNTLAAIIKKYLFMILGCISYALSLRIFLIPNEIVGGGVSGAASLIEIVSGLYGYAGYFIVAINIPIFLLGLKLMGWKFIIRALITTATLGLFTTVFSFSVFDFLQHVTENKILSSVYGGILQGIGIALFIKYEMSSGGTELLGRVTNHFLPIGTIAVHVAFFDGLVVVLGALVLKNIENVLYALILIFTSAKVCDLLVIGLEKAKLCYIITDKAEEIADVMIHKSPRGMTLIQGEGMYSKTDKGVLITCVKRHQIPQLRKTIKEIDEHAFFIVSEANEVYGQGFHSF